MSYELLLSCYENHVLKIINNNKISKVKVFPKTSFYRKTVTVQFNWLDLRFTTFTFCRVRIRTVTSVCGLPTVLHLFFNHILRPNRSFKAGLLQVGSNTHCYAPLLLGHYIFSPNLKLLSLSLSGWNRRGPCGQIKSFLVLAEVQWIWRKKLLWMYDLRAIWRTLCLEESQKSTTDNLYWQTCPSGFLNS